MDQTTSARAVDLARQLRESREYEAASLRLAHSAGVTNDDVRAEVEHHRAQWARMDRSRAELEEMRGRLVDLAHRLQHSESPDLWTLPEVGAALESAITGQGFRIQIARIDRAA